MLLTRQNIYVIDVVKLGYLIRTNIALILNYFSPV